MDSDSGYDYDGASSDGGGYYDSDGGGYYDSDVCVEEQWDVPHAGDGELEVELQVNVGVDEEYSGDIDLEAVEPAGDYGGQFDLLGDDSEGEEDDEGDVEIEVEEEADGDYDDELEFLVEESEDEGRVSDINGGGGRIVYYDESEGDFEVIRGIPSSILHRAPIPMARSIEIDQVRVVRTPEMAFGSNGVSSSNQGQEVEASREVNQAGTALPNARVNGGSGGVKNGEGAKDLEKKQDSEMASSSGCNKLNGSEMDGFSCPICMEPWTSDGEHSVWYAML